MQWFSVVAADYVLVIFSYRKIYYNLYLNEIVKVCLNFAMDNLKKIAYRNRKS